MLRPVNVAGIKILPSMLVFQLSPSRVFLTFSINGCMLLFIISGSNSDIYINSRTLYSLAAVGSASAAAAAAVADAQDGHVPKFFAKVNRFGTPYYCLCISFLFALLGYTCVKSSALTTFKYFVSAVTLFSTGAWISISFSHIRFMKACKVQGVDRGMLPYRSPLQPFLSWWTLIGTIIVSIVKGFDTIVGGFQARNFVVAYSEHASHFAAQSLLMQKSHSRSV